MSANSEGSGETARTRRLAWAFACRLCDKYRNLMSWLNIIRMPSLFIFGFWYFISAHAYVHTYMDSYLKTRNSYMRLRIRHASCGIRFQYIWISCVNAHASVYKDTLDFDICCIRIRMRIRAYGFPALVWQSADSNNSNDFEYYYAKSFYALYSHRNITTRADLKMLHASWSGSRKVN